MSKPFLNSATSSINRRDAIAFGFASAVAAMTKQNEVLAEVTQNANNGMPPVKIRKVKAIATAPNGIRLVVVKVETDEPGLYGLGCATYNQRPLTVVEAVDIEEEDFRPSEEIDADQSIPFPTDI